MKLRNLAQLILIMHCNLRLNIKYALIRRHISYYLLHFSCLHALEAQFTAHCYTTFTNHFNNIPISLMQNLIFSIDKEMPQTLNLIKNSGFLRAGQYYPLSITDTQCPWFRKKMWPTERVSTKCWSIRNVNLNKIYREIAILYCILH